MCWKCQLTEGRNPIFCAIPPYILRHMAAKGNEDQRRRALNTLSLDTTARALRMTYQSQESRARRALMAALHAKPQRTIYDFGNNDTAPGTLPGKVIRTETGGTVAKDPAANEAFDYLGATFNFYNEVFGRNSIDDEGLHLDATVHYAEEPSQGYNNAFWNGQQMVFGDGDGEAFNRFTIDLDIVGHELTHGVTGHEINLIYLGQSGALNESISDVFGSLIKQYAQGQTFDEADWLIGTKTLLVKGRNGEPQAVRSMKAPGTAFDNDLLGKDPQPANMEDYRDIDADNGGVHENSGIPNHAFYLVAKALGGKAWEKAGRIWYNTIRDTKRVRRSADFADFAAATIVNAGHLYGTNSPEQEAVVKAWDDVGVKIQVS